MACDLAIRGSQFAVRDQYQKVISKPLCDSTMFTLTLHHRPETNRKKGERELTLFSPILPFSCLIWYESVPLVIQC